MQKSIKTLFLASAAIACALPAFANDGAIAHRKAIFQAVGGHMKGMVAVLKGQVPHKENLPLHAKAMADLSQMVAKNFPPDSDFGDTRARRSFGKARPTSKKRLQPFRQRPVTSPRPTPMT